MDGRQSRLHTWPMLISFSKPTIWITLQRRTAWWQVTVARIPQSFGVRKDWNLVQLRVSRKALHMIECIYSPHKMQSVTETFRGHKRHTDLRLQIECDCKFSQKFYGEIRISVQDFDQIFQQERVNVAVSESSDAKRRLERRNSIRQVAFQRLTRIFTECIVFSCKIIQTSSKQ